MGAIKIPKSTRSKGKFNAVILSLGLTLGLTLFTGACSNRTVSLEADKPMPSKTENGASLGNSSPINEVPMPSSTVSSAALSSMAESEVRVTEASQTSKEPTKSVSEATATGATYKPATGKPVPPADRKELSWYYMKKPTGQVPNFPNETKAYTSDMKALWVGTGKKVYLTIDTGGPLGDTELLVKSLKDNKVKANFFIAGYNVKKDPDFVRTLVKDGHLVANHTMTHTDMNLQTDEQVKKEIQDYELLYKEVTGQTMQPYFRFPYGRYNMHLLKLVSDMGYSSVFWSTAMKDWEPRKNGADDPYNDIMNNLHDGNIILMHQGSKENIEALDRIIKGVKKAGYEFDLLTNIQPPVK